MLIRRYQFIVTDSKDFVRFSRDVTNGREFYLLFVVVLFCVSFAWVLILARLVQVIEVNVSVISASCKTKVVFVPVDAPHTIYMPSEFHSTGAVSCVEVENINVLMLLAYYAREQIASMREPNFGTAFDRMSFERCDRARQNIAH